jgi:hypothetical protein
MMATTTPGRVDEAGGLGFGAGGTGSWGSLIFAFFLSQRCFRLTRHSALKQYGTVRDIGGADFERRLPPLGEPT